MQVLVYDPVCDCEGMLEHPYRFFGAPQADSVVISENHALMEESRNIIQGLLEAGSTGAGLQQRLRLANLPEGLLEVAPIILGDQACEVQEAAAVHRSVEHNGKIAAAAKNSESLIGLVQFQEEMSHALISVQYE